MAELWEKQAWETPGSYAKFADYYLPQSPPRSALEAYRRHYSARRGRTNGARSLPGSWQNWVQGRNMRGETQPGAVGWAQRAEAYDAYQRRAAEERRQQELADRMRAYDEAAMRVVERGIRVVERMLEFPLQETTIAQDGQRITIAPARWTMDTAAKLVPALDRLYRLLYSLPTEQIDATTRVQQGYEHLNDSQLDDELTAYMERLAQAGAREVPGFAQGEIGAAESDGDSQSTGSDDDHATGSG